MLIAGDISGIQDFLFDVRETGGKQAATLRVRSFRLQLITECIARRVLWACGLDESRLVFCAAGKFGIDAFGGSDAERLVEEATHEVQAWLMEQAHGRLRLAVAAREGATQTSAVDQYINAMAAIQTSKLRAWASARRGSTGWDRVALVTKFPWDAEDEAKRDAAQANRLLNSQAVTLSLGDNGDNGIDAVVGVTTTFRPRGQENAGGTGVTIDLNKLSRHIPRDASGHAVEFVELATRSRGAPMLGVLKADADSLGAVIRQRLQRSRDLSPLRDLSEKLENFFGTTLDQSMANDARWSNLYTVFSGGDDLLLVGPWNIVLDFAGHLREAFTTNFASENLTISAGVALIKPKFPIRLAAQQAEDLLDVAKTQLAPRATQEKDQLAALGDLWKWADHARIIDAGKQLADWVDAGDIQRGWLHTLLELALLQRGEGHARSQHLIPAMAGSRLAYHVARNWPTANKPGESGAARRWMDTLMQQFDRYPDTTDPIVTHLPSILRYAMLATRSSSDKE